MNFVQKNADHNMLVKLMPSRKVLLRQGIRLANKFL